MKVDNKIMDLINEMKDTIVDLKIGILTYEYPTGYCVRSYRGHDYTRSCDDVSCMECRKKFFTDKREKYDEELTQYINETLNLGKGEE